MELQQNNQLAIKNNPVIRWVTKPEECLQRLQISTGVDVLLSSSPSLVKIISELKEDGPIACKAILTLLINEMLNFFNVGKTMDQRQVAATINLILEDYGQLKPDDFKLCFKKAMRGQYGKVYDRIDGELIFEWLEQYLYDKESEIENYRRNENTRLKKDSAFLIPDAGPSQDPELIPIPDYVKDLVKKKPVTGTVYAKPLTQTEQQKQINEWMLDFDNIWSEQGSPTGKRYVTVDLEWSLEEKVYEEGRMRDEIARRLSRGEKKELLDGELSRRIKMIGFKRMDVAEYVEHRHKLLLA